MNKTIFAVLLTLCLVFSASQQAQAVTLYIGDVDGFGFGDAAGLVGVDGVAANRTGSAAVLDSGDVLPDLNTNGVLATGQGDDFDNRSAAEAADASATGTKWTDVSLSTSFRSRPGLADDALFTFLFAVPSVGDLDYGVDHFVNFVYGDYDVVPMTGNVEGNVVNLLGNVDGGVDGYIWRAYAPVAWADMLDGKVEIDIIAPNEPYVAFDYALLDTKPIDTHPSVPEPSTLLMLSAGLIVPFARKRKK